MNGNLIEVFIEKNCDACMEVLEVVTSFMNHQNITLQVFDREEHQRAFRERSVFVCPATFVNRRLAFYGAFSSDDLLRYLESSAIHTVD